MTVNEHASAFIMESYAITVATGIVSFLFLQNGMWMFSLALMFVASIAVTHRLFTRISRMVNELQ